MNKLAYIFIAGLLWTGGLQAQEKEELIHYGDMEHWVIREIKESGIIGGNVKTLYELGPDEVVSGREPYVNRGGSLWATSNVLAKVSGVYKTNVSVFKEPREGGGYCAKLLTHIEKVKVLGLVNISVIAAGSISLGSMTELITGTKEGLKYLNNGIPFTKRPKALRFDYKLELPGDSNRLKMTGFSGKGQIKGADSAIVVLFLQKRTEGADGNIYAERVGTLVVKYGKSTSGWVDNATYNIYYGDMSHQPDFDKALMGLRDTDYALNSKGNSVIIKEIGWASSDTAPTHLCLQFASSHGGAYIGTPGNTFWIDNVRLVY